MNFLTNKLFIYKKKYKKFERIVKKCIKYLRGLIKIVQKIHECHEYDCPWKQIGRFAPSLPWLRLFTLCRLWPFGQRVRGKFCNKSEGRIGSRCFWCVAKIFLEDFSEMDRRNDGLWFHTYSTFFSDINNLLLHEFFSSSVLERKPKICSYRLPTHRRSAHRKIFWWSLLISESKFWA